MMLPATVVQPIPEEVPLVTLTVKGIKNGWLGAEKSQIEGTKRNSELWLSMTM